MTDMYSAGFYPFSAQEEKWAYWSKHIFVNRYLPPALPLYRDLFSFLENKNYFVITTNVDHQFYKAGFQTEKIFAVQGDYGKFQCANGCHSSLYDNEAAVREMVRSQKDCRIPASLVPVCPVCGADMEVHIRKDARFVQDDAWYETASRMTRLSIRHGKARPCFWNWASVSIRRRSSDFLSNGLSVKIAARTLSVPISTTATLSPKLPTARFPSAAR